MTDPFRVLHLGAGVQSTTVALMSAERVLPRLDAAIFADTGNEPRAVYRHLHWLEAQLWEAGIPVYRVEAEPGVTLRDAVFDVTRTSQTGIPAYVKNAGTDQEGKLWRKCTRDFKIGPLVKKRKELAPAGRPIEVWFGISLDEVGRMRTADKGVTFRYPLVFDIRMTRWDCHRWLAKRHLQAPRSACTYCPMHDNDEWRWLRDNDPEGWAEAVEVDAQLRDPAWRAARNVTGEPFLHRSLLPLAEVDLSTPEDHGQTTLFGDDCEGLCRT